MPSGFLEDAAWMKNDRTIKINLKEMEITATDSQQQGF